MGNSQLVNVAVDKPVDMSTVSEGHGPELAVDGNMTVESRCSVTNSSNSQDQWWRVDLQDTMLVRFISLLLQPNVSDDSGYLEVYVLDKPEIPDEDLQPWTESYNQTNLLNITCDTRGRYVLIMKRVSMENNTEDSQELTLCEVEVFVCMNGSYGSSCSSPCGKCAAGSCDPLSGVCPGGCLDGYIGDHCNTECENLLYGPNCSLNCGQCGGNGCDHVTGWCHGGCKDGYTGNTCHKTVANPDEGLSVLAAGGIGAAISFVVTLIIVAVIILILCRCLEQTKQIDSNKPKIGVNAVRYGRHTTGQEDIDAQSNVNHYSLDRNHPYEQLGEPRYETMPTSLEDVHPIEIITPDAENEDSRQQHYLQMSGGLQHMYESMDNPSFVVSDDPEALGLPQQFDPNNSLGANSYITMRELNAYENTQM